MRRRSTAKLVSFPVQNKPCHSDFPVAIISTVHVLAYVICCREDGVAMSAKSRHQLDNTVRVGCMRIVSMAVHGLFERVAEPTRPASVVVGVPNRISWPPMNERDQSNARVVANRERRHVNQRMYVVAPLRDHDIGRLQIDVVL